MSDQIAADVRAVLDEHGRLTTPVDRLADTDDLYRAGLTSHASVSVMLACEDAFDIEFSAELLSKKTFSSIASISDALRSLGAGEGAGESAVGA